MEPRFGGTPSSAASFTRLCSKFDSRREKSELMGITCAAISRDSSGQERSGMDRESKVDRLRGLVEEARSRDFDGEEAECECGGPYSTSPDRADQLVANFKQWIPKTSSLFRVKRGPALSMNNVVPRFAAIFVLLCIFLQDGQSTYAAFTTVTTQRDPEFVAEIGNFTVPAGRNVKLACRVKDLGSFKVAWMLFDKSAILTVQNHVITRNPRISVTHDDHTTWYLHINNVHEDDKGKYMCQINTAAAKTQYGYLHVVVPPNIDDSQSSSDAIVREGANVTLTCKATGSPTPSIRWKRDDNSKISINKSLSVLEWEGETLEMTRISRLDMGAYLCIASNGIPPAVSKQIKVSVDFPPMLWIPHQLVGVPLGYSVTLECHTEAHPTSLNYWTRENGLMIHDSNKYKAVSTAEVPSYKTHMTLTIHDIQAEDYGVYKCVAKNPRGETDGSIRLYKSDPPSTSPTPSTTEGSKKDWDTLAELNNSVYGHPNSLTVHNEKNMRNKLQSNLNEIGKSEQKSTDLDRKRNYNWTPDSDGAAHVATIAPATVTLMGFVVITIIR